MRDGEEKLSDRLFDNDLIPSYRSHYQFLFDLYLGNLDPPVKLLIAEYPYLSPEFIHDHSVVFNICHEELDRACIRIHFFSKDILPKEKEGEFDQVLRKAVSDKNENQVQTCYLGFAVLRNFGSRRLVKVVLKRFPTSEASSVEVEDPINTNIKVYRMIPAKVRYPVNLLGLNLYVDSLAYREQDKATGACATCALWSTFQKTSNLFNHRIPSPSQITAMATGKEVARPDNIFPSSITSGLNINQMASVIAQIPELQPLKFDLGEYEGKKESRLHMELLYAYLRDLGIPSILACKVYRRNKEGRYVDTKQNHAITVTGYNLKLDLTDLPGKPVHIDSESYNVPSWRVLAHRISSLIIHDDNIGPYVQYCIDNSSNQNLTIRTKDRQLEIKYILIPLCYPIRTTYQSIYDIIFYFQRELCRIKNPTLPKGKDYLPYKYLNMGEEFYFLGKDDTPFLGEDNFILEWDIYLTMSKNYKNEVLQEGVIKNDEIRKINFPMYVWRACAYAHKIQFDPKTKSDTRIPFNKKGALLLEMIFDSTSIDHCRLLYGRLCMKDKDMKEKLRSIPLRKDVKKINIEIAKQLLKSCKEPSQKKKGEPTLPAFLSDSKWKSI